MQINNRSSFPSTCHSNLDLNNILSNKIMKMEDSSSSSSSSSASEESVDSGEWNRRIATTIRSSPSLSISNAPSVVTPTTTTSNMILSMMQSMPFLVFPQIAAAAAAAAAAATTNSTNLVPQQNITQVFPSSQLHLPNSHHYRHGIHHHVQQHNQGTDFSINSILNQNTNSLRSQNAQQVSTYPSPRILGPWNPYTNPNFKPNTPPNDNLNPFMTDPYDQTRKYHQNHHSDHSQFYNWLHHRANHNHYDNSYMKDASPDSPQKSSSSAKHSKVTKSRSPSPRSECDESSDKSSSISKSNLPKISSNGSSSTNNSALSQQQKRKSLNRGPRIPFTSTQVSELESKFNATQYLSSLEVSQLAKKLNLTDNRIRIWFQNRRAREKRDHRPAGTGTSIATTATTGSTSTTLSTSSTVLPSNMESTEANHIIKKSNGIHSSFAGGSKDGDNSTNDLDGFNIKNGLESCLKNEVDDQKDGLLDIV